MVSVLVVFSLFCSPIKRSKATVYYVFIHEIFMAYLFDVAAETCVPLAPHHTFGRLAASVDTAIDKPYVSKLHAAIEWNGYCWRFKNLGQNGSWVNGQPLGQGDSVELSLNDLIHIAENTDPGFHVMDLAPPADMLWPLDKSINAPRVVHPVYLSRYHLLPDHNAPELAIYFDEQEQAWYLEATNQGEQHIHLLQQGDLVQFDDSHWQFIRAQVYGPTEARSKQIQRLSDFEFEFNLSLDEETVQLDLRHPQQRIDLAVRTHHYLLLQLARHRAADVELGLDHTSQGWVYAEQLATELGLDTTHMNIQIFRARKQLADTLPTTLGHQHLLERRGGKIRFGCERFKIYKGDTLVTLSSETPHSVIE